MAIDQDQAVAQETTLIPSHMGEKLDFITKKAASAEAFLFMLELRSGLENADVVSHLNGGIINYIITAGVLIFACKDVDEDSVKGLLSAINMTPNPTLLQIVRSLHYRTYSIYINAFYFMMAIGMEPTLEGCMDIARAMEANPDLLMAQYAIDYCKKFNTSEDKPDLSSGLASEQLQVFKRVEDIVYGLFNELLDVVMAEPQILVRDKHLTQFSDEDILPLVAAINLLGLSAREQVKDNIEKVMYAAGASKKRELLNLTGTLRIKNHISYIIALLYPLAVGNEPSVSEILNIVKVMGISPDITIAEYVLSLYKTKTSVGVSGEQTR